MSNVGARFPHLASFKNGIRSVNEEEDEEVDEGEEDPDEIAYRERLRKLAEEDDESVMSDPFGLNSSTRPTASSTFADDKLSLDAQRALDFIRKTSMAIADDDATVGRVSVWTEDPSEENEEAVFKAQQARLKALAAAAQPASHVRNQLTRANMPKPPGLADPEKEKLLKERQNRLTLAETAAVMASGVSVEHVKDIKPHIDQVVKTKVTVVDRANEPSPLPSPKNTMVAPPPGLVPPPPGLGAKPAAPQPPAFVKKQSMGAPEDSQSPTPPPAVPSSRKSAVIVRSSRSGSDSPKVDENRKSIKVEPIARTNSGISTNTAATKRTSVSLQPVKREVSSIQVQQPGQVQLYGSIASTKQVLDILTWRTPLLAIGWMAFGACLVAAIMSTRWSSITAWALAALLRIFLLRILSLVERFVPASLKKYATIEHKDYLPGSYKFTGDILYLIAGILRELAINLGSNWKLSFVVLVVIAVIGSQMNVMITVVTCLFLTSATLAAYTAMPQVFGALVNKSPTLKSVLDKI